MFFAKQLTKTYDQTAVVKDVSFSLKPNECIALIGPNGAGKTTALRMIVGLIKPTSGKVYFEKEKNCDIRSRIGYLPQQPVFYEWMTGEQFLIYCAQLYHIPKKESVPKVAKLLEKVGLHDAKSKRIRTYSGGMKQRLGIAQAILHEPELLLLDEPVSALDPIGRREVLTLMSELKKETTILFSTHILNDAEEVSDELILLHHGSVIEAGNLQTLREQYQAPVIELQFDTNSEATDNYVEELSKINSVLNVSVVRDKIHLSVTDIVAAREKILAICLSKHWPIHSFAINEVSLEDLFMKAVKSSCNG